MTEEYYRQLGSTYIIEQSAVGSCSLAWFLPRLGVIEFVSSYEELRMRSCPLCISTPAIGRVLQGTVADRLSFRESKYSSHYAANISGESMQIRRQIDSYEDQVDYKPFRNGRLHNSQPLWAFLSALPPRERLWQNHGGGHLLYLCVVRDVVCDQGVRRLRSGHAKGSALMNTSHRGRLPI